MRSLLRLDVDDEETFRATSGEKQEPIQTRLRGLQERVFARYACYVRSRSGLENVAAHVYVPEDGDALRHAYSYPTRSVKALLEEVKKNAVRNVFGKCSYCDAVGDLTIDHYLPKQAYPEFSILAENLVPVCSPCNRKKGNRIEVGGRRAFYNPYVDIEPTGKWLYADLIDPARGTLMFSIARPRRMSVQNFELIERHFAALGLLKRYLGMGAPVLQEALAVIRENLNGSRVSQIRSELKRLAVRQRDVYGQNHFRTAVFEAVANRTNLREVIATLGQ